MLKKSEDQLEQLITEFHRAGVPVSRVMEVTPAMAEKWLENNPDNRRINDERVAVLGSDLINGRWELNGAAVIIARTMEINDGQHRLWAVVNTGLPATMFVTFGVERDTRFTVDIGAVRTVGNFLQMQGTSNSVDLAAIAGRLLHWEKQPGTAHFNIQKIGASKVEALQYFHTHRHEIESIYTHVTKHNDNTLKMFGPRSFVAFLMILFARKAGEEAMMDFWTQLYSGTGLNAGSPLLYLRNRFGTDHKMKMPQRMELYIRGWNAWREGRSVKTLPVLGGDLPTIQ